MRAYKNLLLKGLEKVQEDTNLNPPSEAMLVEGT